MSTIEKDFSRVGIGLLVNLLLVSMRMGVIADGTRLIGFSVVAASFCFPKIEKTETSVMSARPI